MLLSRGVLLCDDLSSRLEQKERKAGLGALLDNSLQDIVIAHNYVCRLDS